MIGLSLLLIFALAVVSTGPAVMLKRTMSGVPLFLVSDFQIIERNTNDLSLSEEFSENSSAGNIKERTKREPSDEPIPPQPLLDYRSNTLVHRILYPDNLEQVKTKLTNRPAKPGMGANFEEPEDNYMRVLRSVSKLQKTKLKKMKKAKLPNRNNTSLSETFSGNSSKADSNERTKREVSHEPIPPQPLIDYRSKKLAHPIRYPDNFDQTMKAMLTNRPPKEANDSHNHIRALRSVPKLQKTKLNKMKKAKLRNRNNKSLLEVFSGNSSSSGKNERTKRETSDEPIPPQPLFDYRSNTLAHRIRYPGNADQMKEAQLISRPSKPGMEANFDELEDNYIRSLRSVPKLKNMKLTKMKLRKMKNAKLTKKSPILDQRQLYTEEYLSNLGKPDNHIRVFFSVPLHRPLESAESNVL